MHLEDGFGSDANGMSKSGFRPAKRAKGQNGAALDYSEEQRLRAKLRKEAPSEPWIDAQFVIIRERNAKGEHMVQRIFDPSVFPPGGGETGMIPCPICQIFTPPTGMERGVCLDHSAHAGWGSSPSAQAIRALQYYKVHLVSKVELAPESTEALLEEIRQYELAEAVAGKGKLASGGRGVKS